MAYRADSVNHLSAVERLSVFFRSVGFETAKSEHREERVLGEPVSVSLAPEALQDILTLRSANSFTQMHIKIGAADISIVLDDFIFQNQVIPECVPRQVGYDSMVLMEVVAIVRED